MRQLRLSRWLGTLTYSSHVDFTTLSQSAPLAVITTLDSIIIVILLWFHFQSIVYLINPSCKSLRGLAYNLNKSTKYPENWILLHESYLATISIVKVYLCVLTGIQSLYYKPTFWTNNKQTKLTSQNSTTYKPVCVKSIVYTNLHILQTWSLHNLLTNSLCIWRPQLTKLT